MNRLETTILKNLIYNEEYTRKVLPFVRAEYFSVNGWALNLQSQWPGNQGYGPVGRPRSATLVITRDDGGVIGI